MDIETLKEVAADLFGNSWRTHMAKALGVDGSTVRRWLANGVEAPSYIAAYLDVLGDRQEARGAALYGQFQSSPASFTPPEPLVLDHMLKRLKFPGVDQLKPMPAIHLAYNAEGKRIVRLDGNAKDSIVDPSFSYTLVRHPDTRHLAGFLKAAGAAGHSAAIVTHRYHHYSLMLSSSLEEPTITHIIATHAGEIRITTALASDPGTEISNGLSRVLEYD